MTRTVLAALLLATTLASGESPVAWCWSGGVTDTGAVIVGGLTSQTPIALRLTPRMGGDEQVLPARAPDADGVVRFSAAGLQPGTAYAYSFVEDGLDLGGGVVTTMPPAGRPANFRFAVGSCNRIPDSPVFTAIAATEPLFFLHTGDFHYDDIARDEPALFRDAIQRNLRAPRQAALLRSVPIAYVWDDHDYGPNNSRHDSPARAAAHLVYRQLVPHHPFALSNESPTRAAPIAQAFSVGRVRFILTDLRSEHSREAGSLMGLRQRTWFLEELRSAAANHALVVWVSSVPWIAKDGSSRDNWAAAGEERRLIANHVRDHRIPLCIVSGDAHMVAIDDGSNADYAEGGGARIPVFQAGALDRKGSYKGGPYSHGARPGSQQFGVVEIEDDGKRLRVVWSARDGADPTGQQVLTATKDGSQPITWSFTVGGP